MSDQSGLSGPLVFLMCGLSKAVYQVLHRIVFLTCVVSQAHARCLNKMARKYQFHTGRMVFSIEAASPGTSQSQLKTVRQNSNASTCTEYICTRRKRTPKNMHDQTKNSQRKKPKEMHATAGFSKQLGLHLSHSPPPSPAPLKKGDYMYLNTSDKQSICVGS